MTMTIRTTRTIHLSKAELDALPEYSMSVPTGTTIGKRWKRDNNVYRQHGSEPDWWMGEYFDVQSATEVGIRWYHVQSEWQLALPLE